MAQGIIFYRLGCEIFREFFPVPGICFASTDKRNTETQRIYFEVRLWAEKAKAKR
jgi:hypothetical protein